MEKINNFFVIEGLDGSGTTTQLHRIGRRSEGLSPVLFPTFEPTDNPIGQLIRKILHKEVTVPHDTLMRLFSADRSLHLFEKNHGILDRIASGETVLSDRYLFSSVAYQSLYASLDDVLQLNHFPLPQRVFFIELSPELCASRRKTRSKEELFDETEMQRKIRDNYYRAFECFPDLDIQIIDGSASIDEITRIIWRSLPYPPIE
ncbi:dTMP kinase [Marispirochaeta aestuarii]|uniref:Thymidylate kinase n=1 Tax=Marispirochaeta aestuarii TaxID=1963862 RepID=A0A1Y1S156_9SPIO|nr:dTMP kinase [Marispirochaeta aestuarii]ORC37230.1 dTMP kinase [Marispirochaeta aestuarii]